MFGGNLINTCISQSCRIQHPRCTCIYILQNTELSSFSQCMGICLSRNPKRCFCTFSKTLVPHFLLMIFYPCSLVYRIQCTTTEATSLNCCRNLEKKMNFTSSIVVGHLQNISHVLLQLTGCSRPTSTNLSSQYITISFKTVMDETVQDLMKISFLQLILFKLKPY